MAPDWLNYHHLQYFWVVAREGSIVRAAEELGVSQPTISQQLQELERACKCDLFERRGRTLALTEAGRMVFAYADQIFSMGRELMARIRAHPEEADRRMTVGVADSVSKLAAWRILEPAFRDRVRIVLRDDKVERLIPDLANGRIDVLLSDVPAGAGTPQRVFNHYLGESEVKFFAQHETARRMEGTFPHCLEGFPMLVPTDNVLRRRQIDAWLKARGIRPTIVAEIEDTGMITFLGYVGVGVFAAPAVIE
jgi:LysR family transcriptional activator of nhaA